METPRKLYYRSDGKTILGPLWPIDIEKQIRSNKLPANVLVCEQGHDVWTDFATWQKAKERIVFYGFPPGLVLAALVIGFIVVLLLTIFVCIAVWTAVTR